MTFRNVNDVHTGAIYKKCLIIFDFWFWWQFLHRIEVVPLFHAFWNVVEQCAVKPHGSIWKFSSDLRVHGMGRRNKRVYFGNIQNYDWDCVFIQYSLLSGLLWITFDNNGPHTEIFRRVGAIKGDGATHQMWIYTWDFIVHGTVTRKEIVKVAGRA